MIYFFVMYIDKAMVSDTDSISLFPHILDAEFHFNIMQVDEDGIYWRDEEKRDEELH